MPNPAEQVDDTLVEGGIWGGGFSTVPTVESREGKTIAEHAADNANVVQFLLEIVSRNPGVSLEALGTAQRLMKAGYSEADAIKEAMRGVDASEF